MKQRNKYIKVTLIIFSCLVFLVSGFSLWARNKGEETPLFSILNYIDTAAKMQSKKAFACGKYETSEAIYTVKIPRSYVFFPISYVGESNWDSSTWVKKEDPCLYDFRSIHFQFEWPSLKPYGRVPPAKHEKKYNVIGVSVDPGERIDGIKIYKVEKKKMVGQNIYDTNLRLLRLALFPNKTLPERRNIIKRDVLELGKYIGELRLYKYKVDVTETTKQYNYRTKQDVFWQTDANNNIHSFIICEYIGPDRDQIPFEDTKCHFAFYYLYWNVPVFIKIDFLGRHLAQWKEIEAASLKLIDSFTTKEDK